MQATEMCAGPRDIGVLLEICVAKMVAIPARRCQVGFYAHPKMIDLKGRRTVKSLHMKDRKGTRLRDPEGYPGAADGIVPHAA